MVFSSLTFLYLFMPLSLFLYYCTLRNKSISNAILMILSLLFYSWGEPIWVCLLIFSAFVDFTLGRFIEKFKGRHQAKIALAVSIIINLSLLVVFKYSGMIVDSFNNLLNTNFVVPDIKLPIGISFYTFQTLSYSIDLYYGKVKRQKSFTNFLLFVSLFPQLIAGPIIRYADIDKQITKRKHTPQKMAHGVTRFTIGLGKKVIIANHAGDIAAKLLTDDVTCLGAWFGIIMFTVQIYFDFSGYSDMAIGLGKMFGFNYLENFNYPYISRSITEFWRRWHISLGNFFRDYVYIPLGGNKKLQIRNVMIVWLLTGIWHGASWNFVFWGMYFGVLLIIEKLFLFKLLSRIPSFFSWLYAMFFVVVGWVIFYFTDFNQLTLTLSTMFGLTDSKIFNYFDLQILNENIIFVLICIIASSPIPKKVIHRLAIYPNLFTVANVAFNFIIFFAATALLVSSSFNPFLYFRF